MLGCRVDELVFLLLEPNLEHRLGRTCRVEGTKIHDEPCDGLDMLRRAIEEPCYGDSKKLTAHEGMNTESEKTRKLIVRSSDQKRDHTSTIDIAHIGEQRDAKQERRQTFNFFF